MESEQQATDQASEQDASDKQLTKPPQRDMRLWDFFTGNDLQPRSLHGAFENMAATSFARGVPDPDGRIINSNAVGFRQHTEAELLDRASAEIARRAARAASRIPDDDEPNEEDPLEDQRVSRTQKHRATKEIIERMSPAHVRILKLAYGPQDQVPAMRARKTDGKTGTVAERKEHDAETRHYDRVEALECWRQVLPETAAAQEAFAAWQAKQRDAAAPSAVATERRQERIAAADQRHSAIAEQIRESEQAWQALRATVAVLEDKAKLQKRDIGIVARGTGAELANARLDRDAARARGEELRALLPAAEREREAAHADEPGARRAADTGIAAWLVTVALSKEHEKMLNAARLEAFRMVREAWNAWADLRGRKRRDPAVTDFFNRSDYE